MSFTTWNLIAKRVGGEPAFVWLNTALSSLIYAPVALVVAFTSHSPLPREEGETLLRE